MSDDLRKPRVALYPGSFDLLTNGHMDLIRRSKELFDHLVVGIGINAAKTPMFTLEERIAVLRECTAEWPHVEVRSFDSLTVQFAEQLGAQFIIRGLRAVTDFEFELQLALMNHRLNTRIETIFLATDPENIFVASRSIKDVWKHGGDIGPFVPEPMRIALERKRAELLAAKRRS